MFGKRIALIAFAAIGLFVCVGAAKASTISYSVNFNAAGSASATGDALSVTNYPGWTYSEYNNNSSSATAGGGLLTLDNSSRVATNHASISALAICGQSTFDVSANPLTVSTAMSGTGGAGGFGVFLEVGNILVKFHPGYIRCKGLRVELDDGSILGGSQHVYVPNQDIGFTPLQGSSNLYTTTMTLKEDAGHTNYLLDFSIGKAPPYTYSTANGGSWLTIPITGTYGAGNLDKVGFGDR